MNRRKTYGSGKAAQNICVYCGRGGARIVVFGGYAHKKCLPKTHNGEYPCQNRANCTYPKCDCGKSPPQKRQMELMGEQD